MICRIYLKNVWMLKRPRLLTLRFENKKIFVQIRKMTVIGRIVIVSNVRNVVVSYCFPYHWKMKNS